MFIFPQKCLFSFAKCLFFQMFFFVKMYFFSIEKNTYLAIRQKKKKKKRHKITKKYMIRIRKKKKTIHASVEGIQNRKHYRQYVSSFWSPKTPLFQNKQINCSREDAISQSVESPYRTFSLLSPPH